MSGFIVYVKANGAAFPVELTPGCNVGELRGLIASYTGIPPAKQKLAGAPALAKATDREIVEALVPSGQKIMVIGTATQAPTAVPPPVADAVPPKRALQPAPTQLQPAPHQQAQDMRTEEPVAPLLAPRHLASGQALLKDRLPNATKTRVLSLDNLTARTIAADVFEALPPDLRVVNLGANVLLRIPEQLFRFTNLKVVQLQQNMLTEVSGIEALSQLEVLDLTRNQIETLPPCFGASLPQLRELSLACNRLSSLPETCLTGLGSSLASLDLSGNVLRVLPACVFTLAALQTLNLERNQLAVFGDATTLPGLRSLRVLNLKHNALKFLDPSVLSQTPVTEVDVTGNPCGADHLESLPTYAAYVQRINSALVKRYAH
eukprot:TRINITY_DN19174_c0_g1_i3.p1 TRINITY_DN19174_c0_g1~~TRINITY_DN19174_c0_g1_i3.p1  ORF type:complete len:376 (-),score=62.25 TRINITY_DN19174_c0_g1_i3:46-1173(-)